MNHTIDIEANADMKDVSATEGGTVNNDVRVVIAANVTKAEAHKALQVISSALIGDQIQLN